MSMQGKKLRAALARRGLVTAPGVYDMFHVGHLNILRHAKDRCDFLIAGVVSDEMCEVAKGRPPIIPAERGANRGEQGPKPSRLAADRWGPNNRWRGRRRGRLDRGCGGTRETRHNHGRPRRRLPVGSMRPTRSPSAS